MNKWVTKSLAMVLVLTMAFLPVQATTATAQAGGGEEEEHGKTWLDVEVRMIDGQPVLVYETEEGYGKIPFALPEYAYADGQKMPLQREGNNILVPTEEGPVAVALEDFCVVMLDGQVALVAGENPLILIPIVAGAFLGGAAGLGAAAALKTLGVAVGVKTTAALVGTGAVTGGAYGWFRYR